MIGLMPRLQLPSRAQIRRAVPRVWWGTLLFIHVPILVAVLWAFVTGTEQISISRMGSAISLLLAITLFVLKFFDVAWLRLHNTKQAIIAVGLLAAIVHGGAVARTMEAPEQSVAALAVLTTGAAGVVLIRLAPKARRALRVLAGLLATLHAKELRAATWVVCAPRTHRTTRLATLTCRIPRAPPA